MRYTVILEHEPDGMFVAHVPALRGCVSQGRTRGEALRNAEEAVALYVETLLDHGQPVPTEAACEAVELMVAPVASGHAPGSTSEARRQVHVLPRNGSWVVRKGGAERASSVHTTQRGAIGAARELAKSGGSEVVVHHRSAAIQNDSRASKALRTEKHARR